jgi:hypothetical protein
MIEFIEKLLEISGFKRKEVEAFEKTSLWGLSGNDFYLVTQYTYNEFLDFWECKKSKNLFQSFDKIKNDGKVKKNTNVIFCLELDDIKEIEEDKVKNKIYSIEENEYLFRKFVLPYTKVNNIYAAELVSDSNREDLVTQITSELNSNKEFKAYSYDLFANENYFFLMLLFIKLPFLKYNISKESKMTDLESTVIEKLKKEQLYDFSTKSLKVENWNEVAENLEKDLLSNETSREDLEDIFNQIFKEDDN